MTATVTRRSRAAIQRSWAARTWLLGEPSQAIRTTPVIELVEELLDILRDQDIGEAQAYTSLRRAVRLLSAFTTDSERGRHPAPLR